MQIPTENIKTRFFENIYKATVAKENISVPFDNLDHGRRILVTPEECFRYTALYGGHHFYKLQIAFKSSNLSYLHNKSIEIFDWGCGQAVATCILIDYFIENKIVPNILKISLIEPSKVATDIGRDLICEMFQNDVSVNEIISVVNKNFDDLTGEDIKTNFENIKIHLFSNIIDVEVFSVSKLYSLIAQGFTGLNRIICTSPKSEPKRTARIDEFYNLFVENYEITRSFYSDDAIEPVCN